MWVVEYGGEETSQAVGVLTARLLCENLVAKLVGFFFKSCVRDLPFTLLEILSAHRL